MCDISKQLRRCRLVLGISEDNTKKIRLLELYLEKAREDIESFCRDSFIEDGIDLFPAPLMSVQEDLAIARYRKKGSEGETSYSLADEKVTFSEPIPPDIEKRLYPYRRLFPR